MVIYVKGFFEEPQDVLGQTGKTVVYVFLQGAACKLRDQNEVACRLDALVSEQPTLLEAPTIDVDAIIKTTAANRVT